MNLTTIQFSILLALVRYRFLTCSQMALMGLGSLRALQRNVRLLTTITYPAPVIVCRAFPPSVRFGKVEHMYVITPYGLVFLKERIPSFVSTRRLSPIWDVFRMDYHHRRETISFHIRLEKALRLQEKHELLSYANYFEKSADVFPGGASSPQKAASEVSFLSGRRFIPDSIFVLSDFRQRGVFALEVEMSEKSPRVLKKVRLHQKALADGIISTAYGLDRHDYVAVFLLRHENVLNLVLEELISQSSFAPFRNHYRFTSIPDTENDILRRWRKVGDESHFQHLITGVPTFPLSP